MTIAYLSLEEVLALHEISLQEFGGSAGIRDLALVESAQARPQQTYLGADLYPNIWDKAAALAHSISENQPFVDGNKRTAALSMMVFLDLNGYELTAARGQVSQIILKVTNKSCCREELADWLKNNSRRHEDA